ncbi:MULTISPECIES: hypothetical protein [unclassified Streptomyces]|uniref:hypothetical protein n=1 Tax=unclassified Streptomyces TaxID=2593676 RepID=UPI00382AC558
MTADGDDEQRMDFLADPALQRSTHVARRTGAPGPSCGRPGPASAGSCCRVGGVETGDLPADERGAPLTPWPPQNWPP